jgi:indolepyruvate ferredoxin oxidoreductase beta subunit
MKKNIILGGVGGQGILSIAAIIGYVAVKKGMFLKQSEVHGMSQRGGDVQANLRISDKEIYSDLIPKGKADMIISVEPMECLRYLPMLSPQGWIITNTTPYVNIRNYPPIEDVLAEVRKQPHNLTIDADKIAKDLGSVRSANMVILGAASPYLGIGFQEIEDAIRAIFGRKGEEIVELNLKALRIGRDIATNTNK